MKLFKTFSKRQIARIFGVNRGTVYAWEGHGFPVRSPEGPGQPAKLDFEEVLDWYLNHEETKGVSQEGLTILENVIRERKAKYYG
jgi:transposase